MAADDIARLFPTAAVYDDAELTSALAEGRVPRSDSPSKLSRVEAFSLEDHAPGPARAVAAGIAMPSPSASLRLNPLYRADHEDLVVDWPSTRYEAEYSARATYPTRIADGARNQHQQATEVDAVRRRVLVDLPERW